MISNINWSELFLTLTAMNRYLNEPRISCERVEKLTFFVIFNPLHLLRL